MNRTTLAIAAAGLLAGIALALVTFGVGLPKFGGEPTITGKARVGGPFTLVDQTGKEVTEKDFLGRYTLVFFGFTNCPDICPSGLQVLSAALDRLGDRGNEITPVFISFDSERDTPETLAAYVKSFHPRLVALSGTKEQIAVATKAYRVYFQRIDDEKNPQRYSFDHSSIFYLMDKNGELLAPIPHTTDVAELSEAISKALK